MKSSRIRTNNDQSLLPHEQIMDFLRIIRIISITVWKARGFHIKLTNGKHPSRWKPTYYVILLSTLGWNGFWNHFQTEDYVEELDKLKQLHEANKDVSNLNENLEASLKQLHETNHHQGQDEKVGDETLFLINF